MHYKEVVSGLELKICLFFFRQLNFSLLLILFVTESANVSSNIVSSSMHPKYFTLECCLISILYIQFSDLFYFEFSHRKYRLKFVLKWILLIINKPVKIFIQLFFSFINVFMLTYKACMISIKKKITFDSLQRINMYEKEQRSLQYSTGHTCRLRKCIPQINLKCSIYEIRSKPIY